MIRASKAGSKSFARFTFEPGLKHPPLSLDEALRPALPLPRSRRVYIAAVETVDQLGEVGRSLRGAPLANSILEGAGRTPWMAAKDIRALSYSMLLYPTTVIFRVTRAIQKAVEDVQAGRPAPPTSP